MSIFRNTEYQREILLDAALTVIAAAFGFFISPFAAAAAAGLGILLCALHVFFIRRRNRKISALSDEIDRVLHGQEKALISSQEEGELSILSSEIRKMTVRLSEQQEQLLADKKRLSAAIEDIFHQLRTPLTAMNLSAEMLREPELPRQERLRIVRDLQRSLRRMRWEVETLLKISKLDAKTALFQKEPVSVRELIRSAAEDLMIPMDLKNLQYSVTASDEKFTGDLRWSAEAVGNLLKNAVEHTPEGGEIRVSASENALYTEILVSDSGPGFSKEEIPRLFDRFYRGQNASEGSIGIGLALARMIITEQNGTLTAGNRKEGGAVFTIRFYKQVV